MRTGDQSEQHNARVAFISAESLINELMGLQADCELRANNLLNDESTRERAKAACDAYGYCVLRLRYLQR